MAESVGALGVWRNWSGSQRAVPARWWRPGSEGELVALLQDSAGEVRVTGAGHSFSALCKTAGNLVFLDHLTGLVSHDAEQLTATAMAGTPLHQLGALLWPLGQGLINQGDIDAQSLAGACGTSTHGTGLGLGAFSAQVRALRLITPSGEVIDADAEHNSDVLHAGATSLGALGVITCITLQNRPCYQLAEREYLLPLREVLDSFEQLARDNRHAEFWAFFRTDRAVVKVLNESTEAPTPKPRFNLPVDKVLDLTSRIAHGIGGTDALMQRLLTGLHSEVRRVGRSHEIFPSPRASRFNEMEYELPLERGLECVEEVIATVQRSSLRTLFPLEYRTVAADDVWLSPFYGRDSASISIHQHICSDYRPLFDLVEPIFWKYGGRPHWGKLHSLDAAQLAELYPRWDDAARVRERLDPQGRMLNEHLRNLLVLP
ncbi:D-arabinono-1,4-lactone oxidase [Halopseudomonas sp.]|uniref:D-arabinono-1,4-lactone oxidase n=1 Tax=Halopseudomonas sp. TaxID=2901191 RepID=UPI00311E14DC